MSTAVSTKQSAQASPQFKARAAGFFWLMTIVTGASALLVSGRLVVLAGLLATACYIAATLFVFLLLKPVNRSLSLLAAIFSVVGCAIGALNRPLNLPQFASSIHFVCFGLHCLLVGYLILRSLFLPRFVGALMVFAGLGWLAYASTRLLSPPMGNPWFMVPGIIGETSLTLWLLVMGVNVQRWNEQAPQASAS